MDVNGIIQMVGSLGFPIVACGFLFYYLQRESERHRDEVDRLRDTLESNTKILAELYTYLREVVTGDGKEK